MDNKQLTHIGPFVERMIYDSWSINGYLVALSAGFLGGACVKIYRGAESIKWLPSDRTHNVTLLLINNFIWACENECISFLPEKPFQPKSSELEKGLLYFQCAKWPDYKAQFKIQDFPYVAEIDEELIVQNASKIEKVTLANVKEELDVNDKSQKAYKKKKSG